jgi:hypothetical protein
MLRLPSQNKTTAVAIIVVSQQKIRDFLMSQFVSSVEGKMAKKTFVIYKKDTGLTRYWAGWGKNWLLDRKEAKRFPTRNKAEAELLEIAGPRPANEHGVYPHIASDWGGARLREYYRQIGA